MFSQRKILKSTKDHSAEIDRLKNEIETADAIVIGAGSGLSTAAGFTYSGERFEKYFSDFIEKYQFRDMYSGGFYPFESLEEHWAYWSRYIYINHYMDVDNGTYKGLFKLVKDKDYFVLTTNVDHQFQKAGFDKHRLFYTQGDYGLFQCSQPCCQETYDNEAYIQDMLKTQKNMRIPTELIPHCPKCGKPMTMNLRADDTFQKKLKLIGKEMRVGFFNGLLLGVLSFVMVGLYIMLFKHKTILFSFAISGCIGVSLMLAMLISSAVGTLIPLFFKKIKVDPAVASGPLITTVNDLVAVVTYYGMSWILLLNILKLV